MSHAQDTQSKRRNWYIGGILRLILLLFIIVFSSQYRHFHRGHSMGAAAAAHFCQKCNHEILLLDTRDPTSWINHLKSRPSNVIHWRNALPGEPFLRTPESRHMDMFYFCGFNMANVFRQLGGPWGMRDGAINLIPSACDHHDVGEAID